MAAGDLHNNIKVTPAIDPASPATTGTITGDNVVDREFHPDLEYVISAGAQTAGTLTVTPVVMHGTVSGTLTSAPDTALFNTEASAALDGTAGADSVSKIGYKGANRFVRLDLIVANAATGIYSAVAIQSGGRKRPDA